MQGGDARRYLGGGGGGGGGGWVRATICAAHWVGKKQVEVGTTRNGNDFENVLTKHFPFLYSGGGGSGGWGWDRRRKTRDLKGQGAQRASISVCAR